LETEDSRRLKKVSDRIAGGCPGFEDAAADFASAHELRRLGSDRCGGSRRQQLRTFFNALNEHFAARPELLRRRRVARDVTGPPRRWRCP